ncbi:O-antigen ligase family protein [Rhodococcus sp. NPDC003318]|uniref:O-antigen ligase family protein n=1 Tax=Rhodococcus sp. NPDC003318 TaxID=3364503 RepID=UPI0036BD0454
MTRARPCATAAGMQEIPRGGASPPDPARADDRPDRLPWLLGFFYVLVPVLPTISVLAGPLKSNGSPARLVAFVFFALAVMTFTLLRRSSPRAINVGAVLISIYFFAQVLVYGVGLLARGDTIVEASKTRAVLGLVASVGVVLYTVVSVRTTRQRAVAIGLLATALTFACTVGLLQSYTGVDLRFLFQPPGFVLNNDAALLSERQGSFRVVGTSQHAIEFSVLAAATVPLTLHLARFATHKWCRGLAVIACVIAVMAIPASVSRSGVISLAAALLLYMFSLNLRQLGNGILIGFGAVLAYVIAFPVSANALWSTIIHSEQDDSVLTRLDDYAAVSQTFHDHPWFGLGLGATPPTEYRFLDNEWLQSIAQGGMVGLGAMMLLAASGIIGIAAGLRGAASPRDRGQVYSVGSAFVAVLVSTFTFDLFSFQQASLLFFALYGLVWSTCRHPRVAPSHPTATVVPVSAGV